MNFILAKQKNYSFADGMKSIKEHVSFNDDGINFITFVNPDHLQKLFVSDERLIFVEMVVIITGEIFNIAANCVRLFA